MTTEKGSTSSIRLIALALAAGAIAGAGLLYVRGGSESNEGTPAAAQCPPASATRAKAAGGAAKGDVAAMVAADPRPMGAFAFNGPDGKAMTLGDLKGKTLLVNLWATWCAPCRAEMPALDRLQSGKGGADFEVVAINIDKGDDAKPKKFLEETGVKSLAYYRDNTLGVFNALKKQGLAYGLPVTLLIDKDSCLVANMNGPAHWDSADAEALIEAVKGVPGS